MLLALLMLVVGRLGGPLALARDLVIRFSGAQQLLARQDWIYDWRA